MTGNGIGFNGFSIEVLAAFHDKLGITFVIEGGYITEAEYPEMEETE
jgi:hypothetical protein